MMDQVDFLMKHKRLREASETVLLVESPRRWGKPFDYPNAPKYLTTEKCMKKDPFIKKLNKRMRALDKFFLSRTRKLLQSSSKQSRIISVVCK